MLSYINLFACENFFIIPKIELGLKHDFDSACKDFSRKLFLDIALTNREKEFERNLYIKFETTYQQEKIFYRDFKNLLNTIKLHHTLKEIIYTKNVNGRILSLMLRPCQQSIIPSIGKSPILENASSFNYNSNKKHIIALSIEKKAHKIVIGFIGQNNHFSKEGFLSLAKKISAANSFLSFSIEKWEKNYALILDLCSLYNSIGIRLKNQLSISDFSQMQGVLVAEPMRILNILLCPWISNILERKYLLTFLKHIIIQTIFSYENKKFNFRIILSIRNAIQLNTDLKKYSVQKFGVKNIIYNS